VSPSTNPLLASNSSVFFPAALVISSGLGEPESASLTREFGPLTACRRNWWLLAASWDVSPSKYDPKQLFCPDGPPARLTPCYFAEGIAQLASLAFWVTSSPDWRASQQERGQGGIGAGVHAYSATK